MHSGIATMSREFVIGTAHEYDWVQLGAAIKHPDEGKVFDISADVNKEAGIDHASVKIYACSGYGNPQILQQVMNAEQPDAILHFTDPRFWIWLYQIEHTIRQHILRIVRPDRIEKRGTKKVIRGVVLAGKI